MYFSNIYRILFKKKIRNKYVKEDYLPGQYTHLSNPWVNDRLIDPQLQLQLHQAKVTNKKLNKNIFENSKS